MRRVHICDPQLHGQGGHYLNHDAQLVRELQQRGLPVSLYGRRACKVSCGGLTPAPVFSHDIFQEAGRDSQVWAIENFHNVNQAFLADLSQLSAGDFSSDDLVYFPNLLQNQIYAVALWLGRLPAERRPAVAIMLRYLNHAMDYVQARANKELIALYYRYAVGTLLAAQPRTIVCADTRELAAAYQKITGIPVLELPNPMDVAALVGLAPAPAKPGRPTIVYQGHTSALRGLHFLPEIIERSARLSPRPHFVVQIQTNDLAANNPLRPTLERLARLAGDDLRLVHGELSAADYFGLLASADIILLPYSPTFYGCGSSGVFTEAASIGKVVVVSEGTVPARQGREYSLGLVTAAQWTPAAMAGAVATAVKNLPTLKAAAARAAPRFRADQCARVLWDKLLAAVESKNTATKAAAAA